MCPLADTKTDYLDLIHKFPLDSSRCLKITVKSRIQPCERSELRLHLEWTKVHQKMVNFGEFFESLKVKQAVLRVLNFDWTKIDENEKIQKFKCDIMSNFQTLCTLKF